MNSKTIPAGKVVISVVSHGQLTLICNLLRDLQSLKLDQLLIVITLNISEDVSRLKQFDDLNIFTIRNRKKKGFGENHNFAFSSVVCNYFLVVNPDIRITELLLEILLSPFGDNTIGAVAPVVYSPSGSVEDSIRRFPTLPLLFRRIVLRQRRPDYQWNDQPIDIDWSAGMFIAFRSGSFLSIGGFDTRYFMYYEDADICLRLKKTGLRTVLQPRCSVIHDAQRASHRNIRHFMWHFSSILRILFTPTRSRTSNE